MSIIGGSDGPTVVFVLGKLGCIWCGTCLCNLRESDRLGSTSMP